MKKKTQVQEQEQEVETSEETKKTNIIDWCKEHPKSFFAIRCTLWVLFAAILPFAFIAWRYGIFTSESQIKLTGYGIVAIIIVIVFIITLLRYLYKGLKPGLAKQCIVGFTGIILPLVVVYLLITGIQDNINLFKQALGCVIICELVGIPLNPFPDWLEKRRQEEGKENAETTADIFWSKFFDKKNKNDTTTKGKK